MLFDIERTTIFDVPVLRVVGEIDLTTSPLLTRAADDELAFERAPDGRHRVTLEKRLESRPALRLIE